MKNLHRAISMNALAQLYDFKRHWAAQMEKLREWQVLFNYPCRRRLSLRFTYIKKQTLRDRWMQNINRLIFNGSIEAKMKQAYNVIDMFSCCKICARKLLINIQNFAAVCFHPMFFFFIHLFWQTNLKIPHMNSALIAFCISIKNFQYIYIARSSKRI